MIIFSLTLLCLIVFSPYANSDYSFLTLSLITSYETTSSQVSANTLRHLHTTAVLYTLYKFQSKPNHKAILIKTLML